MASLLNSLKYRKNQCRFGKADSSEAVGQHTLSQQAIQFHKEEPQSAMSCLMLGKRLTCTLPNFSQIWENACGTLSYVSVRCVALIEAKNGWAYLKSFSANKTVTALFEWTVI